MTLLRETPEPTTPEEVTALVASPVAGEAAAVANYLKHRRYRVMVAATGAEAETLARESPLEVAVVDLRLTDPPGLEITSLLRARHARLPLIVIQAGASPTNLDDLNAETLQSPFRIDDLRDRLTRAAARADESPSAGAGERRRHARAQVEVPATIECGGGTSAGSIEDVSVGGMRVRARQPVPAAEDLTIALQLPTDGKPLRLQGKVLRVLSDGALAVMLIPPPLADRARHFSYVSKCILNSRHVVLMVDGSQSIRDLAREELATMGFGFRGAGSVAEAGGLMEPEPAHVLAADLDLPDGDGLGFVCRLREGHPGLVACVTVDTAHEIDEDRVSALGLALLRKPWQPGDLLRLVENLVRGGEGAGS